MELSSKSMMPTKPPTNRYGMPTAEIRNMTPGGIHQGELKTMSFSGAPAFAVSKKIRELYDQGFFMRRATPGTITRAHTIAEVLIRDQALKLVYRKMANGELSCTQQVMHNQRVKLASQGKNI